MPSSKINQNNFTPTLKEVIVEAQASNQLIETTINPHVIDKNNPHGVTAEQVGAATETYVDNSISAVENKIPVITTGTTDIGEDASLPSGEIYLVLG